MKDVKLLSNPWFWVPTLYFAEGIPYFLVNSVSTMLLTRNGVSNSEMSLFTSLLYLPWVIKPLWSPFVDMFRTKRYWIVAMEILLSVCFVGLTLSLPHPSAEVIANTAMGISPFYLMLIFFWISAFASATHDIAADGFYMLALDEGNQSVFVGIRSTFYRLSSIFGQGVLIAFAGYLENKTGNIPFAWQMTLLVSCILFSLLTIWHLFTLPRVERATNDNRKSAKEVLTDFIGIYFVSFFKKKGIITALIFILLYRLPEAFLIKIINPFFVSSAENGGLAMQTQDVGLLYGTIGVMCLTIGGILGGLFVARFGLKRSLITMALFITLPDAAYLYLSIYQPASNWIIGSAIAVEQFGYGFGFTAYMLYLIFFSEGEHKTSHYAFCTGIMAAGMMLPGMMAGYLQEAVGYTNFFVAVMVMCLVTLAVTLMVRKKVPDNFGKKEN